MPGYNRRMIRIIAVVLAAALAVVGEVRAELGVITRLRDDGTVVLQCKLPRKLLRKARSSILMVVKASGETTRIKSRKRRCRFVQLLASGSAESYRVGVRLRNGTTAWSDSVTVIADEYDADFTDEESEIVDETTSVDDYDTPESEVSPPVAESPSPNPQPEFDISGNCSGDAAIHLAELTNEARIRLGQPALQYDVPLMQSSHRHSQIMGSSGAMSHDGWFETIELYGFAGSTAGQNIASGFDTPESALSALMNSPSHRSNILSPKFGMIGVGCVEDASGRRWWTQNFGG